MLATTEGLVLKQVKYNDKSNIVTIFTREFGKKSFIVFGINSPRKGGRIRSILQPLFPVKLVFYYKETQTLGKIKDIWLWTPYSDIIRNFNKKAVLLFLSEVLHKSTAEHLPDLSLFDFVINALRLFDLQTQNYANFHLLFMVKLTKFLGIEPQNNFSDLRRYFSIPHAQFTQNFDPTAGLDYQQSKLLSQLLKCKMADFDKLRINRIERNQLLQALVNYYAYHIENFAPINSLQVLHTVFDS